MHADIRKLSRKSLGTCGSVRARTFPLASLSEWRSRALALPCSEICAPAMPLRPRQSNEVRFSTAFSAESEFKRLRCHRLTDPTYDRFRHHALQYCRGCHLDPASIGQDNGFQAYHIGGLAFARPGDGGNRG